MRNKLHLWGVTAVLFAATFAQVTVVYLRLPAGSRDAPLQWTVLGAWLLILPFAIWRQLREFPAPTTVALNAGARLAIVGYFGVMVVLWLMQSLLT